MAGGIDWFRWHHGSVTDPKFALVARRAGASLPDVLAVWAYLLEQASASVERGTFSSVDCEAWDCLFGFPATETRTADILRAMQDRDLIGDGVVIRWEKRQPKREREGDTSTTRVQAFRDRKRQETPGNATSNQVRECSATEGQETPREEKSREEKNKDKDNPRSATRIPPLARPEDVAQQVWDDWTQLRKAKRAPVNATTVEGARSEADKAGMSLEAFLRVWCSRGSQGLQAEWLKPNGSHGAAPVRKSDALMAANIAAAQRFLEGQKT